MALPVSIVVAVAENRVIGRDGEMPWKLSSDLKRFKEITLGNPIIMGRKTFESIGRALPGRHNIIITRNTDYRAENTVVVSSLDDALQNARQWAQDNDAKEICIIGGGEIYRQSVKLADRLYYTKVDARPDGDTCFPAVDPDKWQVCHTEAIPAGPKDNCATEFITYERP
jgi:dihydrofolate reductase